MMEAVKPERIILKLKKYIGEEYNKSSRIKQEIESVSNETQREQRVKVTCETRPRGQKRRGASCDRTDTAGAFFLQWEGWTCDPGKLGW